MTLFRALPSIRRLGQRFKHGEADSRLLWPYNLKLAFNVIAPCMGFISAYVVSGADVDLRHGIIWCLICGFWRTRTRLHASEFYVLIFYAHIYVET